MKLLLEIKGSKLLQSQHVSEQIHLATNAVKEKKFLKSLGIQRCPTDMKNDHRYLHHTAIYGTVLNCNRGSYTHFLLPLKNIYITLHPTLFGQIFEKDDMECPAAIGRKCWTSTDWFYLSLTASNVCVPAVWTGLKRKMKEGKKPEKEKKICRDANHTLWSSGRYRHFMSWQNF